MIRRRHRDRRGAAAIEFGLWMPVLTALLTGIIDVSWYLSRYHNVVRAARDGARFAVSIVEDNNTLKGSEIESEAVEHSVFLLNGVGMPCADGCLVAGDYDPSPGGNAFIEVSVTYPYQPLIGLVPLPTTMTSTFTMLCQDQEE